MSRYARRADASHQDVLRTLRASGLAVRDLSRAGDGCPDLAVSFGSRTAFVEVKTPGTYYGKRLNEQQQTWAEGWEGELLCLRTAEEAMQWAVEWKRQELPAARQRRGR